MHNFIRSVDKQRRIVVPKEALKAAGINPGDLVALYSDKDIDGTPTIVIEKFWECCALCGGDLRRQATVMYEKKICPECIEKLKKEDSNDQTGT